MTDTRLQQLRRAWQASGSTADEAAYLLERVRVGDLTTERLDLAAYCGCEGALLASRRRNALATKLLALSGDLPGRVSELALWGQQTAVEFCLLMTEGHVEHRIAETAVESARAWLECPCDTHRDQASACSLEAFDIGDTATRLCSFAASAASVDLVDAAQAGGSPAKAAASDLENATEHYLELNGPESLLDLLLRFGREALTAPAPQVLPESTP